jgi:hypothetical protein
MRARWKRLPFRLAVYAAVPLLALGGSVLYPLSTPPERPPSPRLAPPPRDFGPLPTVSGQSDRSRIQPFLGRVAAARTEHAVEVRCWSNRDWVRLSEEVVAHLDLPPETHLAGYVLDTGRVNLPSETCNRLLAVRRARIALEQQASAIKTYAHELEHADGIENEATAECYAYQSVEEVARALGSSPARGRRLAAVAWKEIYPSMPAAFRSSECRDGGSLDLRPLSRAWP